MTVWLSAPSPAAVERTKARTSASTSRLAVTCRLEPVTSATALTRRPYQPSGRGGLVLDRDVAGAVGVDLDTRAHGRGDGDLADVAALGAGRLEPQHLL